MNAEGKLILSDDGNTELDYYFPFENVENPSFLADVYLLEWALGLDEWTDVTDICNVSKAVRMLENMGTYEDICKAVTVRSKKEILDKADLL